MNTSEGHTSAVRILRDVPVTSTRFYRSTREAFADERYPAIEIMRPRRASLGWRVAGWASWSCAAFLLAAEVAGWLP